MFIYLRVEGLKVNYHKIHPNNLENPAYQVKKNRRKKKIKIRLQLYNQILVLLILIIWINLIYTKGNRLESSRRP